MIKKFICWIYGHKFTTIKETTKHETVEWFTWTTKSEIEPAKFCHRCGIKFNE